MIIAQAYLSNSYFIHMEKVTERALRMHDNETFVES